MIAITLAALLTAGIGMFMGINLYAWIHRESERVKRAEFRNLHYYHPPTQTIKAEIQALCEGLVKEHKWDWDDAMQQACDQVALFANSMNPRPLDIAVPKSEHFEGKRPKTSSGE